MKDTILIIVGILILLAVAGGNTNAAVQMNSIKRAIDGQPAYVQPEPVQIVVQQPQAVQPEVYSVRDNMVPTPAYMTELTTTQLEVEWLAQGHALPDGWFVMSKQAQREWLLQNLR